MKVVQPGSRRHRRWQKLDETARPEFLSGHTGTNGDGGDLALDRWYRIASSTAVARSAAWMRAPEEAAVALKSRSIHSGTSALNTLRIGHSSGNQHGRPDRRVKMEQAKPERRSGWNRSQRHICAPEDV
jgi:hypothetical protein